MPLNAPCAGRDRAGPRSRKIRKEVDPRIFVEGDQCEVDRLRLLEALDARIADHEVRYTLTLRHSMALIISVEPAAIADSLRRPGHVASSTQD